MWLKVAPGRIPAGMSLDGVRVTSLLLSEVVAGGACGNLEGSHLKPFLARAQLQPCPGHLGTSCASGPALRPSLGVETLSWAFGEKGATLAEKSVPGTGVFLLLIPTSFKSSFIRHTLVLSSRERRNTRCGFAPQQRLTPLGQNLICVCLCRSTTAVSMCSKMTVSLPGVSPAFPIRATH